MKPRTLTLITAVVAVLALAVIALGPRLRSGSGGDLDLSGQPHLGAADAPVEVVLFEDFRCSHCASFTETVFPLLEREFVASGAARIYYLNFPVLGPASVGVAEVGECVYQQSEATFWQFKTVLFRSQGGGDLERRSSLLDLVRSYAPDIDISTLQGCLDSDATSRELQHDQAMARSLQLTGTPSVLVNGRLTTSSYDAIAAAIRQALADQN